MASKSVHLGSTTWPFMGNKLHLETPWRLKKYLSSVVLWIWKRWGVKNRKEKRISTSSFTHSLGAPIIWSAMLKNSTECVMMNMCNLVEKLKKYFQEVEDARPLASMIRNDWAGIMAKDMLFIRHWQRYCWGYYTSTASGLWSRWCWR